MAITNYEQIARQVLMTGDPTTGTDGRLYLDGQMVQSKLSEAIAESIYVGEIFRDGQSVTSKYTVNAKAGDAVRVPLETPFPSSSRTLGIAGREGTQGNGGIINTNAPMMPADDEFVVFLNQLNDQMILFPDLSMDWLPVNKIAQRVGSYSKTVVEDRSASTLAEIIAYSIYRSLNSGDNINTVAVGTDNAIATLLNNLNTKLDNGDPITNAHAFPTNGRCIIGRPSFVNAMLNRNSGVILTGSDIAQTMLKEYKFDKNISERDYVGNAYKGNALGFDIQSANDYIWNRAEAYLGLAKGSLNHVLGVAVSFDATAASTNIDLGVKMVDHSGNPRGLEAQPINCWGHEGFRKSQIIGDNSLSNDVFVSAGFTDSVRKYPIAPKDVFTAENSNSILVPIYSENGSIAGYQKITSIPKANGGNIQSGSVYSLSKQFINVATTSTASEVHAGEDLELTIAAANANYNLPGGIVIRNGGVALTLYRDYTYNSSTGAIKVFGASITAAIAIEAVGVPDTYTVTGTLSHCTATNTGAGAAVYGVEYSTVITADSNYALPASLGALTVGGTSIASDSTKFSYNSTTGVLKIYADYVTGAIAFSCTATA